MRLAKNTKLLQGEITRVRILTAAAFVAVLAASSAASAQQAPDPTTSGWSNVFSSDWRNGIDPVIEVQRATPDDLVSVMDPVRPGQKALQATVDTDEDFSAVANGSPRAEIVFPRSINFAAGNEYLIRWSTFIPRDVELNPKYPAVITQIHQGPLAGSPPISLMVRGAHYQLWERDGSLSTVPGPDICCSDAERGAWVKWVLDYVPDSTGIRSSTRLWKNDVLVHVSQDVPNAYPNDAAAYLKMGIYGPGWKTTALGPLRMRLLLGPVSIFTRAVSTSQ